MIPRGNLPFQSRARISLRLHNPYGGLYCALSIQHCYQGIVIHRIAGVGTDVHVAHGISLLMRNALFIRKTDSIHVFRSHNDPGLAKGHIRAGPLRGHPYSDIHIGALRNVALFFCVSGRRHSHHAYFIDGRAGTDHDISVGIDLAIYLDVGVAFRIRPAQTHIDIVVHIDAARLVLLILGQHLQHIGSRGISLYLDGTALHHSKAILLILDVPVGIQFGLPRLIQHHVVIRSPVGLDYSVLADVDLRIRVDNGKRGVDGIQRRLWNRVEVAVQYIINERNLFRDKVRLQYAADCRQSNPYRIVRIRYRGRIIGVRSARHHTDLAAVYHPIHRNVRHRFGHIHAQQAPQVPVVRIIPEQPAIRIRRLFYRNRGQRHQSLWIDELCLVSDRNRGPGSIVAQIFRNQYVTLITIIHRIGIAIQEQMAGAFVQRDGLLDSVQLCTRNSPLFIPDIDQRGKIKFVLLVHRIVVDSGCLRHFNGRRAQRCPLVRIDFAFDNDGTLFIQVDRIHYCRVIQLLDIRIMSH